MWQQTAKQIDDDVVEEMKHYSWPGNVRELKNVLERMIIMSGERITATDLPEEILATSDETNSPTHHATLREFRDHAERQYVINTLKRHQGNITQAAQELGVGRPYLHKRLGQLNIEKKDYFN